jgi:hypothetical protein
MAEASNSFSPVTLLKRLLQRIHISRGMLKMRISVMELGRFTLRGGSGGQPRFSFDYAPRAEGNAMHGWARGWKFFYALRGNLPRDNWRAMPRK